MLGKGAEREGGGEEKGGRERKREERRGEAWLFIPQPGQGRSTKMIFF